MIVQRHVWSLSSSGNGERNRYYASLPSIDHCRLLHKRTRGNMHSLATFVHLASTGLDPLLPSELL